MDSWRGLPTFKRDRMQDVKGIEGKFVVCIDKSFNSFAKM
jgi:hypothetical protein